MRHRIGIVVAVACLFALPPASLAQTGGMGTGHDMSSGAQKPKSQAAHKASGTVTAVDQAAGKVTISHGPVQTLNWPAMTMNFMVKDKALLGKLSPGRTVDFEFVQQGRDYVVTSAK